MARALRHLPATAELLLLKAAALEGNVAREAWLSWQQSQDIALSDKASYELLPAVYRNLSEQDRGQGNGAILHGIYRKTWLQNQLHLSSAAKALDLLQAQGIEALILKGAVLARDIYGDIAARPMADVDILVPTVHAETAYGLLLRNGWQPQQEYGGPMAHTVQVARSMDMMGPKETGLDLHWHVLADCCDPDDDDDFWDAAIPYEIHGRATRRLCATDLLLHVLVHGSQWSGARSVRWTLDAHLLIARSGDDVDWSRLLSQARKRALVLPVRTGLEYLRNALGTPIPDSVLSDLRSLRPELFDRLNFDAQNTEDGLAGWLRRDFVGYLKLSRRRPLLKRLQGRVWRLQTALNVSHVWQLPGRIAVGLARRLPFRPGVPDTRARQSG
jgi:hypothetical protein